MRRSTRWPRALRASWHRVSSDRRARRILCPRHRPSRISICRCWRRRTRESEPAAARRMGRAREWRSQHPVQDAVMSDWGQGYHVGIAYTLGFYPELAPSHLEAALLFAGFKSDVARAGTTYCELGCGYGLTTLVLAAANPQMSFVGVDFNPIHIVAARALSEAARLSNIALPKQVSTSSWSRASPISANSTSSRSTASTAGSLHRFGARSSSLPMPG